MDILTFIERHPIWSMIALMVVASCIGNLFRPRTIVVNNVVDRKDEN